MSTRTGAELLIQIKALCQPWRVYAAVDWKPISIAPFDRNLELAVIDRDGPHTFVFPCRRILGGRRWKPGSGLMCYRRTGGRG